VMLQIVVEVAGTVCDADCSIFSQTVDRQPPPTADQRHLFYLYNVFYVDIMLIILYFDYCIYTTITSELLRPRI